jgi:hypothetical protein
VSGVNWEVQHTVELDEVVRDGLHNGAIRLGLVDHTSCLCLPVHVHHDTSGWQTAGNQEEDEGTKSPTPVVVLNEQISNCGTGECACDARGLVEGEDDHAVLESGHIGHHDGVDIEDTDVPGPVQYVPGNVCLNVVACGFESHADENDEQHNEETLDTAEDIDELGHGKRNAASERARHDTSNIEKTVSAEC